MVTPYWAASHARVVGLPHFVRTDLQHHKMTLPSFATEIQLQMNTAT